jgi:hypothetical protein
VVPHALAQLDSSHVSTAWAALVQAEVESDWQPDSRLALKTPPGQMQLRYALQLLSNPLICDEQLPERQE